MNTHKRLKRDAIIAVLAFVGLAVASAYFKPVPPKPGVTSEQPNQK